jgi:hypothetical protein
MGRTKEMGMDKFHCPGTDEEKRYCEGIWIAEFQSSGAIQPNSRRTGTKQREVYEWHHHPPPRYICSRKKSRSLKANFSDNLYVVGPDLQEEYEHLGSEVAPGVEF